MEHTGTAEAPHGSASLLCVLPAAAQPGVSRSYGHVSTCPLKMCYQNAHHATGSVPTFTWSMFQFTAQPHPDLADGSRANPVN